MLILICLLAFYLAWNLGANDVANSMGTSVGSKAISLRQALAIAGILEFTGAVLFGRNVSATLATGVIQSDRFATLPQTLLTGMIAVLIACGIWLNIATAFKLPVSSSHATVGAIAGFAWVAVGQQGVDWRSLITISLTWVATPVISGAIAALFYGVIRQFILRPTDALDRLREWIPWLSATLLGVFGVIVLPTVSQPLAQFTAAQWGWHLPEHDIPLGLGAIATAILTLSTWRRLARTSPDSGAIVQPLTEQVFAQFQVISACCVAFAHGSNDVGNAVAPVAAIVQIQSTGAIPGSDFQVPVWVLVLGGVGIVAGLAIWGNRVIGTIGEGIIPLQPSSGFCAELATATTVLLASRFGLPVSTSHALVGGVVGIGLLQDFRQLKPSILGQIALAWLVTIPIAAGLSALIFLGLQWKG